jgi:23S rRNA pseudouridine1911/1915/1917 synthase
MQMAVFADRDRKASSYPLQGLGTFWLCDVDCQLETGRTHQIRVHLKHIGHTLFNDERYGVI